MAKDNPETETFLLPWSTAKNQDLAREVLKRFNPETIMSTATECFTATGDAKLALFHGFEAALAEKREVGT